MEAPRDDWRRHPDVWAVVIAAMSLVLSVVAVFMVKAQLDVVAGQVRAYVQVVDVSLQEPITEASFIALNVRVRNCGQTAAVNVHGDMDYHVGMPGQGESNDATRRDFGAMGPGMERVITLTSNRLNRRDWPHPQQRLSPTVYFFGTVWYTDDTTHRLRKEDWCYELPLRRDADLTRTELARSTILSYTSKASP